MRRILFLFFIVLVSGCSNEPANVFQGYVEGEYIHVASPKGGALVDLAVRKGQNVKANTLLFALERDYEKATIDEAHHGLKQAQNNLANLEKGQRPSEIASIEARLDQAIVSAKLAETEYKRRVKLLAAQTISQEELDQTQSDFDQKTHMVKQIEAELATARLGARSDEIDAATASVQQAQAKLDQAVWSYKQKTQYAPVAGLVFDTLYQEGEWVAPGSPVVSLLPPTNINVRFFVPQTMAGSLENGEKVLISLDGRPDPVSAKITYIYPSVEFTPPVIYSSSSRSKLVIMVKAEPSPEDGPLLHPGQPVDVIIPSLEP